MTPDSSRLRLEAAARELRRLLDAGEATRGLEVSVSRGAIVLSRGWSAGPPGVAPEPRFRLTPLGAGRFGLALYRRHRWERLPFLDTPDGLADVMNTVLAHWAAEW